MQSKLVWISNTLKSSNLRHLLCLKTKRTNFWFQTSSDCNISAEVTNYFLYRGVLNNGHLNTFGNIFSLQEQCKSNKTICIRLEIWLFGMLYEIYHYFVMYYLLFLACWTIYRLKMSCKKWKERKLFFTHFIFCICNKGTFIAAYAQ